MLRSYQGANEPPNDAVVVALDVQPKRWSSINVNDSVAHAMIPIDQPKRGCNVARDPVRAEEVDSVMEARNFRDRYGDVDVGIYLRNVHVSFSAKTSAKRQASESVLHP